MPVHHEHIDAANQTLGRIASRIATLLRGKNRPDFTPHRLASVRVTVENLSRIRFTGSKLSHKAYYRFSGYPGGLKTTKLQELFARSPEKVLRLAVYRMLPANKHRSKLIKRITVTS